MTASPKYRALATFAEGSFRSTPIIGAVARPLGRAHSGANQMNSDKQNSLRATNCAANITRQAMRFLFAPSQLCAILFLVLLAVPCAPAQEIADTIRVRTRVVFMD